ncbi:MAG: helix-turn-helix domain-containing protein [Pseudomonadota bacterium]
MNSEWAEQPKDQAKLATPGAQLAAQREAMGLTVEQIADQLKLAPRQVTALEAGDYASLPNMAVTRGFVRAYAKVVKLDAAPLVAMIEVNTAPSTESTAAPVRRERIATTFSESRFPSMTQRSSKPAGWVIGAAVVALIVAAVGAYQTGLLPGNLLGHGGKNSAPPAAASAPPVPVVTTTTVKPGTETPPLQSPNVPLVSVSPADGAAAPASTAPAVPPGAAPATAPVVAPPVVAPPAPAPVAAPVPAPVAAAPAAQGGGTLVVKVLEDSWVEIRRTGKPSLISRLVKAGSTETFEIDDPALLIVGKPTVVKATLRGAPLELTPVPGGTIARVNIK